MDTRIFDSQAPRIRRGRRLDVTEVDVSLDSNGDGIATASFSETVNSFFETSYNATDQGQTPAPTSVDKANETDSGVPVYVNGGAAGTTVTVTVTRYAEDRSGTLS